MKYRAEIDGLRALAVIPVILFHAGFSLFSGGYVGVDIFFVISGYLITTILIEDIENNRFSLANFYDRRARRILPALFFVMLACIPLAWLWMLPSQLKDFSESLAAVSLFISNFLFWHESGYFAAASEEKPLLHTWSLAVEEQYYILFPIFLLLAWPRLGKHKTFWIIVVLGAMSLALSEWMWRGGSEKMTANFYLAPTRAWELFAGSIAAFITLKRGVQANNALSLVGLAAILFSIFYYDKGTPFPSIYALVPVAGAVLLILFAAKETIVAKILSTKVLVGIGLISYSVYLWHQPLFAFARIYLLERPSVTLMAILSLLSLLLGWLSWKFIEKPFRNKQAISRKVIYRTAVLGLSSFIAFGLIQANMAKDLGIYPDRVKKLAFFKKHNRKARKQACEKVAGISQRDLCLLGNTNNVKGVLIGDSHASMLWKPLNKELNALAIGVKSYTSKNCPPIRNFYRKDAANLCYQNSNTLLDEIKASEDIEFVILASRWTMHVEKVPFDNGEGGVEYGGIAYSEVLANDGNQNMSEEARQQLVLQHIEQSIQALIDSGKKVLLMYPIPEVGFNVPMTVAKAEMRGFDKTFTHSYAVYLSRNQKVRALFDKLKRANKEQLLVVDTSQQFCSADSQRCKVLDENQQPYYVDDDHLSNLGASFVASGIKLKLKEFYK